MSLSEVAGGHLILKTLKQKSLSWWKAVSLADTHRSFWGTSVPLTLPHGKSAFPAATTRLCKDNGSLLCPWELWTSVLAARKGNVQ